MANKKTYTWAEFKHGMEQLEAATNFAIAAELREKMYKRSLILQTLARAKAAEVVPGTKPSKGNTHARGRVYGLRLNPSIRRFKNERNKYKAYVVIGNLSAMKGGAFYANMQMGGYRPGRPKDVDREWAKKNLGTTRKGNVNTVGRWALASLRRRIEGKNYFQKAYAIAGPMVQQAALQDSLAVIDKHLARV